MSKDVATITHRTTIVGYSALVRVYRVVDQYQLVPVDFMILYHRNSALAVHNMARTWLANNRDNDQRKGDMRFDYVVPR